MSGSIACGWLDVYFDNLDTDPAAAQAAADALATSAGRDMLLEIETDGGWPSVVWENTHPGLGCDLR